VLVDFETSLIIRATIKEFILHLRQGLNVHLVDSVPLELSHGHALKSAILYYRDNIKTVYSSVTI
jgi:alpha-D-ribose 1-methylphosphonate 5-triphosphate synthase subunit PhnL